MKTEYYRHEYTWSNHCITGNKLGWGITASSLPKNKAVLREMEKLASSLEPDRGGNMPVEELVYSPSCGFVKMIGVPCDAGEDNRNNKKVYLYQSADKKDSPDIYLAPKEIWNQKTDGTLESVEVEPMEVSPEKILIKMNLYDRLPDFLRVVFLCLFEKKQSLNIVAPSWKKTEFADNVRELMYVIHKLIPVPMRKKAGYVSYTDQPLHRTSFYFSSSVCGEHYLNLDTFQKDSVEHSENGLEEYFFYHLAELYVKKDSLYDHFMDVASDYLSTDSGNSNELGKLEWIFYGMCQNEHKEVLDKKILMARIPELLYWSSKDDILKKTVCDVRDAFRSANWDKEEKEEYIHILLEGFTKRAQDTICAELKWILQSLYSEEPAAGMEQLNYIKEKNKLVYGILLSEDYDQKGTFSSEIFENAMETFANLSQYVKDFEKSGMSSELKDQVIMGGIRLLNENLFEIENYAIFDQIIRSMKREEQWADILKDFVGQLEQQAGELSDQQLETACYVEQLLAGYKLEEVKGVLKKERQSRSKEDLPEEIEQDAAMLVPVEEEEEEGSFLEFLLGLFPQGFLTGCSLYLSSYSLMIGHWKIALGMAGIWIILMLNYYSMMLFKEKRYPFWKNLGGCVIMGYLIETIASMILSQKLRLYYFIVLGVVTVLVQGAGIIRKKMGKEEK